MVSNACRAYIQSVETPSPEVFLRDRPPEFELKPEGGLKLLKQLYGLCSTGDMWQRTLHGHHCNDPKMTLLYTNRAINTHLENGRLKGPPGSYMDELIRAESNKFRSKCMVTHEKINMTE